MTDVRPERLAGRPEHLGPDDDGWALFAPGPGHRDLGEHHHCARSLERSRARRMRVAARRPGLPPAVAARVSAAVLAVGVVGAQATGVAVAAPASTATQTLREGDRGSGVRALQRALGIAADGDFGPATERAVRAHQRASGLAADGVVGPATRASLGLGGGSAATGSATPARTASGKAASSTSSQGSSAVAAARAEIGSSYAYGGNGPSSFDCSGLTVYAFRQAGTSLPRTSQAQHGVGSSVAKASIRAGDLVFFDTAGPGASHVGVATSSSSVISATTRGVMEHSFTSGYWAQHFVGARRV